MPAIPEPRTPADDRPVPRCTRHHAWMPGCPACADWHRDQLRRDRDRAARRGGSPVTASELVWSSSSEPACAVGIPGCDCDRAEDGSILPFCECHDCYVCGEIDCDGHP